jgi:hypothetical protein
MVLLPGTEAGPVEPMHPTIVNLKQRVVRQITPHAVDAPPGPPVELRGQFQNIPPSAENKVSKPEGASQ